MIKALEPSPAAQTAATERVTVAMTAGLQVSLSAQAAAAYAAARDPAMQMKILRAAVTDGAAVAVASAGSLVDEVQKAAYPDVTPPRTITEERTDEPSSAAQCADPDAIAVPLTAGLMVSLSPGVATAFAAAPDRATQIRILREALADRAAVPVSSGRSMVDAAQNAAYPSTVPGPASRRL